MKNSDLKTTDNFLRDDCYVFVETMPGVTEIAYLKEDVKEMMAAYGEWLVEKVLQKSADKLIDCVTPASMFPEDGYSLDSTPILNAFPKEWIK